MAVVKSPYPNIQLLPDVDLVEFLLNSFDKYGRKTALKASRSSDELRFDEIRPLVVRIASGLVKAGLKRGDVALTCMNMRIEALPIALGIVAAGGIFTACNPQLTPDEIHNQISDSKPAFLFVQRPFLEKAFKATEKEKDQIENIYVIGEYTCDSSRLVTPFSVLVQDEGDRYPTNRVVNSKEDAVFLFYSSGTTGRQKGVVYTHYGTVSCLILSCANDGLFKRDSTSVIFTPIFHLAGFVAVLMLLFMGNTAVTMERFDIEEYLMRIEQFKVETVFVVPPIVMVLANDPRVKGYNLSSVKEVFIAGAPLGAEGEQLLKKVIADVDVRQLYGMTECIPVTLRPSNTPNKEASVGVIRPNVSAKIVDITTGATLGPNEEGELWVNCPSAMKGYWKNPEADKTIFDEDGWVHTGDIGYFDIDGYLYISDRLKELIKYKGFQVAPAELESLLLGYPDIADVCVIGVPDPLAGEIPKAFVVLKKAGSLSAEEVVKYVQDRTISYKWLRAGVEFAGAIPKSPSGKILRRFLRDAEKEKRK